MRIKLCGLRYEMEAFSFSTWARKVLNGGNGADYTASSSDHQALCDNHQKNKK